MFVMSCDPSGALKGVSVYGTFTFNLWFLSCVCVCVLLAVSLRGNNHKKMSARRWKKRQMINTTMDQDMISYTIWTLSGSEGSSRRCSAFGRIRLDHNWCALARTWGGRYKKNQKQNTLNQNRKSGFERRMSVRQRQRSEKPLVAMDLWD